MTRWWQPPGPDHPIRQAVWELGAALVLIAAASILFEAARLALGRGLG